MRFMQSWLLMSLTLSLVPAPVLGLSYSIRELPGPEHHSDAEAVSDDGVAVGWAEVREPGTLFSFRGIPLRWTPEGASGPLDTVGSQHIPYDLNAHGTVVGSGYNAEGRSRGFVWSPDGSIRELAPQGTASWSAAYAVNDAGQIVLDSGLRAWLLDPDGTATDLGGLGPIVDTMARDISNTGMVVGTSRPAPGVSRAFAWTEAAGMVDLGSLDGGSSAAYAASDAGHVAGVSYLADGRRHAFLWTAATGMIDLGTLGGDSSWVEDVNDAGQVVGFSSDAEGVAAVLWDPDLGLVDLEDLLVDGAGWDLDRATAINASGQIVGRGLLNGRMRAFFLTPVPEPGAWLLLALAAGALLRISGRGRRPRPRAGEPA